jgi:nuclear GTP-binding protein
VKDSKKKKAKEAKKNPQWKSSACYVALLFWDLAIYRGCVAETKKDPGIPNDFPYKDQILAEVAEQRRLVRGEILS